MKKQILTGLLISSTLMSTTMPILASTINYDQQKTNIGHQAIKGDDETDRIITNPAFKKFDNEIAKPPYGTFATPYDKYVTNNMYIVESNGKYGLIDCGTYDAHDEETWKEFVRFAKQLGIKEFEFVYISHLHVDHVSFLRDTSKQQRFLKEFKIKEIMTRNINDPKYYENGGYTFNGKNGKPNTPNYSGVYANIEKMCKSENIKLSEPHEFDMGDFHFTPFNTETAVSKDETKKPYFWWDKNPAHGQDESENLESTGLNIQSKNGGKFVYMGDIYWQDEQQAMDKLGKIDVLSYGHHGLGSSSSPQFLDKVQPQVGIATMTNWEKTPNTQEARKEMFTQTKNFKDHNVDTFWGEDGYTYIDFTEKNKIAIHQDDNTKTITPYEKVENDTSDSEENTSSEEKPEESTDTSTSESEDTSSSEDVEKPEDSNDKEDSTEPTQPEESTDTSTSESEDTSSSEDVEKPEESEGNSSEESTDTSTSESEDTSSSEDVEKPEDSNDKEDSTEPTQPEESEGNSSEESTDTSTSKSEDTLNSEEEPSFEEKHEESEDVLDKTDGSLDNDIKSENNEKKDLEKSTNVENKKSEAIKLKDSDDIYVNLNSGIAHTKTCGHMDEDGFERMQKMSYGEFKKAAKANNWRLCDNLKDGKVFPEGKLDIRYDKNKKLERIDDKSSKSDQKPRKNITGDSIETVSEEYQQGGEKWVNPNNIKSSSQSTPLPLAKTGSEGEVSNNWFYRLMNKIFHYED